jgi:hypothetical protein
MIFQVGRQVCTLCKLGLGIGLKPGKLLSYKC